MIFFSHQKSNLHFLILGLLLLFSEKAIAQQKVLPVLNQTMENQEIYAGHTPVLINLNDYFGTSAVDDQVVRFTSLYTTSANDDSLIIDMALFSNRTPITRANFLNYVLFEDWDLSVIHRSKTTFVLQGGGYKWNGSLSTVDRVESRGTIQAEVGISNTLGTVAMARVGNDLNSATNNWFINMTNNYRLDTDSGGGYTVFGRVTKSTFINAQRFNGFSFDGVTFFNSFQDTLEEDQFPKYPSSSQLPLRYEIDRSLFSDAPVFYQYSGSGNILNHLVFFSDVSLVAMDPTDAGTSTILTYSVVENSNQALLGAFIVNGSDLQLSPVGSATGSANLQIVGTDSVGNSVTSYFTATIIPSFTTWRSANFSSPEVNDETISGPLADANHDGLSNLELFAFNLTPEQFHLNPVKTARIPVGETGHQYQFSFPFTKIYTDVSYRLEYTQDPTSPLNWQNASFTEVSRVNNGDTETITIRANEVMDDERSGFYRLVFELDN